MTRHRGPERVVDDDGVRSRARAPQPAEGVVMMEGVPPAPVDEANPRVDEPAAVEVEGLPGVEQHVRQAGEGDRRPDWIRPLGQGRGVAAEVLTADVPQRPVATAEAATG